jgi:hypothetical protein
MCTTLTSPERSGIAVNGRYGGVVVYALHHLLHLLRVPPNYAHQATRCILDEKRAERGEEEKGLRLRENL